MITGFFLGALIAFLTAPFAFSIQQISDEKCDNQMELFSSGLATRDIWALNLFDAWGKIQSGYLQGNTFSAGRYSECLEFNHQIEKEHIQGQYCTVQLSAKSEVTSPDDLADNIFDWREVGELVRSQNLSLRNGICLPSTCSPEKVLHFTNNFIIGANLYATNARCQTNDRLPFAVIDLVATIIFAIIACLLISSTIYDISKRHQQQEPNKLFIAFSAYTNGQKLFDVTKIHSTNTIVCLNGLRTMSLFWILFGHRLGQQLSFSTISNPKVVDNHFNHIYSTILTSYNIAVDTFFVMGAMLIAISCLHALDKKVLNIPRLILHRYLRYTPVFAALILYRVSFMRFTINDSARFLPNREKCVVHWWSSLLHLQNYVNPNAICAPHTWYLSADFQLFIVSPFLIYPAWRWGWKYLWSLLLLALMSSVYVLYIGLTKEIRIWPRTDDYDKLIYYPTHARMGPWLLGLILGYVLYKLRNKEVSISKRLNAVLWIVAISFLTSVVVMAQPFNQRINNNTSLLANASYTAFHRLAWAAGICWIIFACHKLQTGGIVRWFLCLPHWQPIARMSLSIYLVHLFYDLMTIMNVKEAMTYEIMPMLHLFWGDLLVNSVLGAMLYLAFEVPFLLVESYFYKKYNSKKSKV